MQYETIIFSVGLLIYFIFTALMGYFSRKSTADSSGFFLAGRSLGTVSTTSTLAATTIGGSATILVIGQVYSKGLPFIWTDIAGGIGLILLGLLLAGKVRKMNSYSLPEIIGNFYGEHVRRISAVIVVIAQIGFLALLLRSSTSLLAPYLKLPPLSVLFIVAGIFILYTIVGGQLAVARTDVVQLILMAAGILLILIPCFMTEINLEQIPDDHWHFPLNKNFGFTGLMSLILISGMPHLVGSDIYGKLLSSRDAEVARKSSIFAGIIKIAVGLLVGTLGIMAAGILPPTPPDQVLSALLLKVLPFGVAIVVIFGFIATLMSSADSVLLTAGTVITRDILKTKEKDSVLIGRITTGLTGLAAVAITFFFPTILSAFLFAYTLFSTSLVIPVLAGFWKEKLGITKTGAGISMCGSAIVVTSLNILDYENEIITLSGLLTCSILLFAVSWLSRKK